MANGCWLPAAGRSALCASLPPRRAGAAEIVATDLSDFTLGLAARSGADRTINIASRVDALAAYEADKGHFDILFECSGAAAALTAGIAMVRPGGVIVQLGLGGDMTLPVQAITSKELQLRGSFRFHAEFFTGVELMQKGLIDVKPLISHTVPLTEAVAGFRAGLGSELRDKGADRVLAGVMRPRDPLRATGTMISIP